jgi:hypothetical protein
MAFGYKAKVRIRDSGESNFPYALDIRLFFKSEAQVKLFIKRLKVLLAQERKGKVVKVYLVGDFSDDGGLLL